MNTDAQSTTMDSHCTSQGTSICTDKADNRASHYRPPTTTTDTKQPSTTTQKDNKNLIFDRHHETSVSSTRSAWSQDGLLIRRNSLTDVEEELENKNIAIRASKSFPLDHYSSGDAAAATNEITTTVTINPIVYIWAGLIVTSLLVFFSGMDATLHCTIAYDPSQYEDNDENDDDYDDYFGTDDDDEDQRTVEKNFCVNMFRTIILPSCLITILLCSLSIVILIRPENIIHYWLSCIPLSSGEKGKEVTPDPTNQLRERRRKQLVALGILSFIVLLFWIHAIVFIMLRPPYEFSYEQNQQSNRDDDYWYSIFDGYINNLKMSQFQSLGAVNALGQVGDNANLYYSTWASVGLSFALVYNYAFGNKIFSSTPYWRYSFYRLRERMGPWIVILLSSLLVLGASIRIWKTVISRFGANDDNSIWDVITSQEEYNAYFHNANLFIRGTWLALSMGTVGSTLSIMAVIAHWSEGHVGSSSVPLVLESTLAFFLFLCFFGLAGYVTCTGGPAQKVGNLYYATMTALVLSFRIGIGCLEEIINVHDPFLAQKEYVIRRVDSSQPDKDRIYEVFEKDARIYGGADGGDGEVSVATAQQVRKQRKEYLRRWGTIAICSAIAFGSAMDAAKNYDLLNPNFYDNKYIQGMTHSQIWTCTAPAISMTLSSIMFLMCISPTTYLSFVYNVKVGGVFAVSTFLCWLTVIITVQHSDSSLAVNKHGEILTANLYYFTWASIINAGLNMSTYTTRAFNLRGHSIMMVLWFAVMKVCFVVLSSAIHVWLNIGNACEDGDGSTAALIMSFCFRTKFAIFAGLIGEVLGFIAAAAHTLGFTGYTVIQAVISFILAILFGFSAAFITGMTGPGQCVGDLYYATWLCFVVALAIFREQVNSFIDFFHCCKWSSSDGGVEEHSCAGTSFFEFQEDDVSFV